MRIDFKLRTSAVRAPALCGVADRMVFDSARPRLSFTNTASIQTKPENMNKRDIPSANLTPIARSLQAALLALFASGSAVAAESTDLKPAAGQAQLPAVTIKAEAVEETGTGPVHGYAAERSTTGTKTDTPILETPQSISVVGRQEMTAHGALSLNEALRYVPGVQGERFGIDDRDLEGSLARGFSSSSYTDGLRIPPSSSGWLLGLTEIYGLERVEVLRGPSSVIYGQGDVGGIINKVKKLPNNGQLREVELQAGSHALRQIGLDLGGANTDGTLLWRLVGMGRKKRSPLASDRYPQRGIERQYLAPSLTWQPSAATKLTLLASYLHHLSAGNEAEYLDDNNRPTGVLMGDPGHSRYEVKQWSIGYKFEHRFDTAWSLYQDLRVASDAMPNHITLSSYERADPITGLLDRSNILINESMRHTAVDTRLVGTTRWGSTEHKMLFGLDWLHARSDVLNVYGSAPPLNVYNPVYGIEVTTPPASDAYLNYDEKQRQLGVYIQDQIRFSPRWLLTLGLRHDSVRGKLDDRLTGTRTKSQDSAVTSRVGLTYLATSGLAPYLSYSESFLPAPGMDANGDPFKPTRGKQYEAGIKFQPTGSQILLTAAVYQLIKQNVLTWDPVTYAREQHGEVRARGLEFEAKASLAHGLDLSAQYSFNHMEITRDSNSSLIGKYPEDVAGRRSSVWLDYTIQNGLLAGWGFGTGVRYRGSMYANAENTVRNDPVTLVDAAVHYARGPWRFALNVANLLDKEQGRTTYGVYAPGAKRIVTTSASYHW